MADFANGTAGEMFEDKWCSRCVHSDISGDRQIGVDPPCPVLFAHFLYSYELCNDHEHPGKVILDLLIPRPENVEAIPTCAMFHPIDAGAAIPGQLKLTDAA